MAPGAGTKKTLACLLVGLGALLIVAALMIPFYLVPKLSKTPLDLEITTVAVNPPNEESLVLNASSLTSPRGPAKVDSGVPLVSQRFLTVEDPSDAHQMTFQAGSTLRRIDKKKDSGLLTASVDRVTVDRKTGEPVDTDPNGSIAVTVNRKGQTVAEQVRHTGLQYRFPIGTERKSYPYFDILARTTYDMEFKDETEINGLPVYHFQQTVPATNLWDVVKDPSYRLSLPASKWGIAPPPGEDGAESEEPQEDITMFRWYTNVRDIWVEPKTGAIVKGGEQLHLFYARSGDKPELTALKAHMIFDEDTIEYQAALAKYHADRMSLYSRILPIVLGIIGLIALAIGIYLGVSDKPAPNGPTSGGGGGTPGPDDPDAPTEMIDKVVDNADDAPTQILKIQK